MHEYIHINLIIIQTIENKFVKRLKACVNEFLKIWAMLKASRLFLKTWQLAIKFSVYVSVLTSLFKKLNTEQLV